MSIGVYMCMEAYLLVCGLWNAVAVSVSDTDDSNRSSKSYGTANFEILKGNRNSARWVFTFLASHVNSLSTDDDIVTKTYLYFNLDYAIPR